MDVRARSHRALPVDAIVFDKDGTLFDFAATWEAWAHAFLLRATGQDEGRAQEVGRHIGFDFATSRFEPDSVAIASTVAEVAAALAPHIPEYTTGALLDMINEEAASAPQTEAVPLRPLLDGLRDRGLRLGLATNDSEGPARAHLAAAGVLDRFDFVAGFDSGHGAKPGPGQLLAFAGRIGIAPERVAMVGDSRHDLIAGRAAGMVTLAVLTGMAPAAVLAPLSDAVLPDIGHIPGWLERT